MLPSRQMIAASVLFLFLAALPAVADRYILSVMTLVLMYAYLGIAWNLMVGYGGQLSLGHALFFGLGAYAAAVLPELFKLNAWFALGIGMLTSALIGAFLAMIASRFAVRGIFFALLTIAAAEFTRLLFENWNAVGGAAGYFLRTQPGTNPLVSLRGTTYFFYYAFFVLALLGFAGSWLLVRSKWGYYLRAVRDDEDTARALGVPAVRVKVGITILSAAMTSAAGSIFALMSGSVFPDTVLGMRFSIEMIIAPIIGGLGTLFGPFIGALFVIPAMELSNELSQKLRIFGLNIFVYGAMVIIVVRFLPQGVWPWLSSRARPATSSSTIHVGTT